MTVSDGIPLSDGNELVPFSTRDVECVWSCRMLCVLHSCPKILAVTRDVIVCRFIQSTYICFRVLRQEYMIYLYYSTFG